MNSTVSKTAIVTGAMGGIGYATASLLLQNGFCVVGMDILPPEKCADQIAALGENFAYVTGNLASADDRQALLNAALERFGRVDVLVNVAGVAPKVRRDLLEMTEESYDFVMDINTKGTLFLSQLVANQMVKQDDRDAVGNRGYIVNISSCSAYTSSTSRGEYCVSKAGVSMVTMLFADRLAAEGIPVNEICPGIIATGMTAVVKEKYDKLIAQGLVPQGRWGSPDDVAKAVLALCDGTLGYTTGQSLIVDGGMHLRRL
jgi:NAD(P)-dependent dehydrogenase (short-subunit alcohol dehydrogenase family)